MDGRDPAQAHNFDAVIELLEAQRPGLTFDERDRVDRRLSAFLAPRRRPRPGSRLAVVVCLTFGLLFMTAGTGLAISGLATPGVAAQARYPDATARGHAAAATASAKPSPSHHRPVSAVGQIRAGQTLTTEVSLSRAETHNDLPFTGFDVIPVLMAGIAFILAGAAINRRTRGGLEL